MLGTGVENVLEGCQNIFCIVLLGYQIVLPIHDDLP